MKKLLLTFLLMLTCVCSAFAADEKTYQLVTDLSELTSGQEVVMVSVYSGKLYGVTAFNGTTALTATEVTTTSTLPNDFKSDKDFVTFTITGTTYYSIFSPSGQKYIGINSSSSTSLAFNASAQTSNAYKFSISKNSGTDTYTLISQGSTGRAVAFQKGTSVKNYATSNLSNADYSYPAFYKEVTDGSQKEDASIIVSKTSLNATVSGEAITLPYTYNGDGQVSVTTDQPTIATAELVGNNVVITPGTVAGKAIITISSPETNTYKAAKATVEIVVIDPNKKTFDATVTMKNVSAYTANSKEQTWTSDDDIFKFPTVFSFEEEGKSTYAAKNGDNLRLYNSNANLITVCAPEGYLFVSASAKLGTPANHISIDGKELTNDGEVFTFASPATEFKLRSVSSNNGNKNSDITSMTFVLESDGKVVLKPAELSFNEANYTVDFGNEFTAPEVNNPNNLTVKYTSSDETVASVDATTGAVTINKYGVVIIKADSEENDTYKAGHAEYTLTIVPAAKSIKEFISMVGTLENHAQSSLVIKANFDATVTYVNGQNTYITDGESGGLIYMNNLGYEVGNVIPAGWSSKVTHYNGIYEFTSIANNQPATETVDFVPEKVALTEVTEEMVNEVVEIKLVGFAEATPATKTSIEGKLGDETLAFYNQFLIGSVEAGNYSVKGIVNVYNTSLQFYPIEYTAIIPSKPIVNGEENNGESIKLGEDGKVEIEFFPIEGETVYYKHVAKQVNTETTEDDTENAPRKVTDENGFEEYVPGTKVTLDSEGDLHHYSVINGIKHDTNILAVENGGTTSLSNVAAEGVEAEYFDLMGRKVVNPAQGSLVIERKGSEVRKVIVK